MPRKSTHNPWRLVKRTNSTAEIIQEKQNPIIKSQFAVCFKGTASALACHCCWLLHKESSVFKQWHFPTMSTPKTSSYFLIDLHFKLHTAYNNLLVVHDTSKDKAAKLQGYLNHRIHMDPHCIALFIFTHLNIRLRIAGQVLLNQFIPLTPLHWALGKISPEQPSTEIPPTSILSIHHFSVPNFHCVPPSFTFFSQLIFLKRQDSMEEMFSYLN